jgi:Flp pilus assembly protein TadG
MEHHTQRRSGTARRPRRTRGQALVEFAIVLPVFLMLIVGMIDIGFGLFVKMSVINAAREGARAAVSAPDYSKVPALVTSAVQSAASGTSLDMSALQPPITVCVAAVSVPPRTCAWTKGTPPVTTDAAKGDSVSVRVNYRYTPLIPFPLFGATIDLGSTVQMVLDQ